MYISTHLPLSSLRASFLVQLFKWSKCPYKLLFKLHKKQWQTKLEDLARMDEGSLGKDLYLFLIQHEFKIESKLESHEVSHVLLEYSTDVVAEISMQFFYLGNQKPSLYTKFTYLLGSLSMPEYYSLYQQAFRRGQTAAPLHLWHFEHLLSEKTSSLRALIFNQKQTNILYI